MAFFSPIQSGGESTTSSTSGMSITGSNESHESSRVTMFIGDIDEVELQVRYVPYSAICACVSEEAF